MATKYGRSFYKKGRGMVKYKYVNGKRVATVSAGKRNNYRNRYSRRKYRSRY